MLKLIEFRLLGNFDAIQLKQLVNKLLQRAPFQMHRLYCRAKQLHR